MGFFDWMKPNKAKQAAQVFNEYQSWFSSLDPCDETLDITLTVRVRAFGNQQDKQRYWAQDWLSKHPTWSKVSAGCNVSSEIPELWMDMRMSKAGLVLPPHVLGHEFWHSLNNKDKRIIDPDLLINEDTY